MQGVQWFHILCLIFCCQIYSSESLQAKSSQYEIPRNVQMNKLWRGVNGRGKNHRIRNLAIVNGIDSFVEQFPWLVQTLYQQEPHCGGVIISYRVVLTAAHCLVDNFSQKIDAKHISVLVGSSFEMNGLEYEACETQCHPNYGDELLPYYFYDIGLILLQQVIVFSKEVQAATIAPSDCWKHTNCTLIVAGYGETMRNNEIDTIARPSRLQETTMRFVDSTVCNSSENTNIEGVMPVPEHMFCMIGDQSRPTSDCNGDSGSGVMLGSYVVGLVSTGRTEGCGSTTSPSMYTDLLYFKDWIAESVYKLEYTCLYPINNDIPPQHYLDFNSFPIK